MEAGDGIYDDGEWISWDYLNMQIFEQHFRSSFIKTQAPTSPQTLALIEEARNHYRRTGQRSQLLGEIGELYAAEVFGIERHKPYAQGSDGRIGDMLIEIKTITPGKRQKSVEVKRSGNFRMLVVVRIWGNFRMEARMIDRRCLPKGSEPKVTVTWEMADPCQYLHAE